MLLHWMIFSTLASGLFYGLYCLTLRRDRRLRMSEWYLILTMGFSMAFPFFPMPEIFSTASQPAIATEEYWMNLNGIEIVATPTAHSVGLADVILLGDAVCLVYLLIQVLIQTARVIRLRRGHAVYGAKDGFALPQRARLVLLDDDTAPYSFFNHIVVGTRGLGDDELRCILAHESYHVKRFHTVDLLIWRSVCCLAWFNPFAWLMLRELQSVYEYQADAASIGACGREGYLHLLYREATGTGYGHITNNFLSINIKKRIVMMNKTKTRFGAWKVLAALPVAALLLMVGCEPTATPEESDAETVVDSKDVNTENSVFTIVERDPEYPGGEAAMYKYLSENIHYPEQAKKDGIEGRVFVSFVVEKDGTITGAKVLRGIGGGCDEEALRVVEGMPKWKPGAQRGTPVRVQYNLPIIFKLQ